MSVTLLNSMRDPGADVYYTAGWYRTIETHLKYLREHPATVATAVDPHDAYKYEADLNGLLLQYGVNPQYHHVVMRVNGMSSPTQATPALSVLLIPAGAVIESLRQIYQTTYRKIN